MFLSGIDVFEDRGIYIIAYFCIGFVSLLGFLFYHQFLRCTYFWRQNRLFIKLRYQYNGLYLNISLRKVISLTFFFLIMFDFNNINTITEEEIIAMPTKVGINLYQNVMSSSLAHVKFSVAQSKRTEKR